MHFQTINHHLILLLDRHVQSLYSERGYKSVISSEEISLTLPGGITKQVTPAMAVFGEKGNHPVWIVDIDVQSCGRQISFTDRIELYSKAGIKEHWMIFTKDHIVVVRKNEGDGFGKPVVYGENDMLVKGGIFPDLERSQN